MAMLVGESNWKAVASFCETVMIAKEAAERDRERADPVRRRRRQGGRIHRPVDTITKCSIKDEECLSKVYGNVITSIGKNGIPEYGIPPIDPIVLKDISLSVAGLADITLIDGIVNGITGCTFKRFAVDIEKERSKIDIACDLVVEGKYKLSSSSPLIKTFLNGSSIHGEGTGKVELQKIILKLDYPFYAFKRDGEIYLKCDYKAGKYDYEILGKLKFEADNLYLGEKESSKEIVDLMNKNWKLIADTVGRPFADRALDIYVDYSSKFFDKVPAKQYIADDLSSYARS
ncbi:uncharacterized protein LOC115441980 [Manduca sexta]|uniref:uncharacterized protein LOC115441980 n=1 Tax=Manduca sexta TaxID=7130 RepID=UPI00188F6592|nr:uncharacterized protein LOC115441980 [Manduca sexta]